jgi:DNA-directed RNA polymerase specialized sigma24 family protein
MGTSTFLNIVRARQTDLAEIGKEPGLESSTPDVDDTAISEDVPGSNPDLWLYRQQTVALLRRFFRTRVTPYGASTFEDSVILVHDVERSLEELNEFQKKLIGKIVLQQFSKEETGRILGCGYAEKRDFGGSSQHKTRSAEKLSSG